MSQLYVPCDHGSTVMDPYERLCAHESTVYIVGNRYHMMLRMPRIYFRNLDNHSTIQKIAFQKIDLNSSYRQ